MYVRRLLAIVLCAAPACAVPQAPATNASAASVPAPAAALTIYNENFAVARSVIDLDLHAGRNEVSTNQVTTQLEPDSVVLRSLSDAGPSAKPAFRIAEQDYDAGVVTQDWLLKKYEGKTIDFLIGNYSAGPGGHIVPGPTVAGKIIRAPQPPAPDAYGAYQQSQPLIEVNGQMQFSLPGVPLFPTATDGLLLKPTLRWQIDSDRAQHLKAELAYITEGLNWEATYNLITGDSGDSEGSETPAAEEKADLVGWVTITNRTGADFPQARIKLMAGDVAKIEPRNRARMQNMLAVAESVAVAPGVTQKAFDEFHLYDLNRTVSLAEGETKQVEFLDKAGIDVVRSYVYDGSAQQRQPYTNYSNNFVEQRNYGIDEGNTKVQAIEEIHNTRANHLGIPLPAGRIRLYRRDSDGQMEFVGESTIDHTTAEATIKLVSGNSFDLKGTRRQSDFHIDMSQRTLTESFEIKLTNQKTQPVTISVIEPLYRGANWQIEQKSADYTKLDSRTIEFPVKVPAKGEAEVSYTVVYSW